MSAGPSCQAPLQAIWKLDHVLLCAAWTAAALVFHPFPSPARPAVSSWLARPGRGQRAVQGGGATATPIHAAHCSDTPPFQPSPACPTSSYRVHSVHGAMKYATRRGALMGAARVRGRGMMSGCKGGLGPCTRRGAGAGECCAGDARPRDLFSNQRGLGRRMQVARSKKPYKFIRCSVCCAGEEEGGGGVPGRQGRPMGRRGGSAGTSVQAAAPWQPPSTSPGKKGGARSVAGARGAQEASIHAGEGVSLADRCPPYRKRRGANIAPSQHGERTAPPIKKGASSTRAKTGRQLKGGVRRG